MLVTDLLADAFFVADIVLNFNTGFITEQAMLSKSCDLTNFNKILLTYSCAGQWRKDS